MNKRIEAIIRGSVQNVNFRHYCRIEALRLGLLGFVRNLPGGTEVEVVAEGEENKLVKLADWLRHGPAEAEVEEVIITSKDYTGQFSDFEVLYEYFRSES